MYIRGKIVKVEYGVAHKLPRTVIRDVASPVYAVERHAAVFQFFAVR